MVPIQVRLTKKLVEEVDNLINNGAYSNRSEAIRDAIRKHVNYFYESGFLKNRD